MTGDGALLPYAPANSGTLPILQRRQIADQAARRAGVIERPRPWIELLDQRISGR